MTDPFAPPLVMDAVKRQRLFDLLDAYQDRQNILITGQAAQGKTTLLATYLKDKSLTTIWVPTRADDQDHAKLFNRLSMALTEKTGPQKTIGSNAILGTQKPVLRHAQRLIQMLVETKIPLALVFDDMEHLGDESSGFELVRHLVETRFETLKIYMLSRQRPALNFAWLKMAKNLFVLTNEDLSFTLNETGDFFSRKKGMSQNQIKKIHHITDGWAGGLTLVLESFRQVNEKLVLPERLTAEVFNYFSREIYQQLDPQTQDFLIHTALLDIIDPQIITHLFGRDDRLDILKALENRNLFIQRLETASGTDQFKYHHLFREFLLKDLLKTKGHEGIRALNRKIGYYYWEQKNHETALDFLIRAEDFEQVIRIIKIKGADLIIKGNYALLSRRLESLPEEMVESDPWLIFFKTMTRRILGGKKNIIQFKKALSLFEKANDTRGIVLCIGFLIEAAVFVRQSSTAILEWIQTGETLLIQLREGEQYPWARALLWQHIGLGYIAGSGDLSKGISACRNAILLGQQINTPDLVANASIIMTFGHVQAGDFKGAKIMLSRIKEISHHSENPEYRALKSIVDINFAMSSGKMDQAKRLLTESEADIETFGLIFLYPGFVESKALHALYTEQYNDAFQLADHLRDFSILEGNDFYEGVASRIRSIGFYFQARYTDAEKEINQSLASLDRSKKGDFHYFQALQVSGLIQLGQKNFENAITILSEVREFYRRMAFELHDCETCLALGQAYDGLGDKEKSVDYMGEGIRKAAKENYTYFPMIKDKVIIKTILILVAAGKTDSGDAYLSGLMPLFNRSDVFDELDDLYSEWCKKEKNNAVKHLAGLYKTVLPKLYIQTLGQFTIRLGDQILDQKKFEGAKPVMLLKAIALHGPSDIPKEMLIDDLWPDSAAKAGEKNFKINLHRLRKAIEPSPRKEFGYSYILQKAGLVSFDPDLVETDTQRFNTAFNQGMIFEAENQFEAAVTEYSTACQLYKGAYFSEEPYQDWIRQRRDLYRTRYLELLMKKARLHEELDQIDAAIETWHLALNTDPCFETAYQNLMILFADTGQKSRAMEVFHNCTQALKKELGSDPDAQTLEIYEQILGK